MRKLATAAVAFSAAVSLAYYLVPPAFYLPCIRAGVLLALGALLLRGDARRRLLFICLAAALGFAASHVSWQQKTLPAREISGEKLHIEARVTDYPKLYDNFATIRVQLTGENTPHLYAELYSFGSELNMLTPGDLVSAPATLKAADERYGLAFGADNAENVYLLCYLDGELNYLGESPYAFLYFPKALAQAVKASAQRVFPADAAPLMTALLTGDTMLLYQDAKLYAAMSEAGILHIVAISGMNVAFHVGFIGLLIRRKRTAALVSIPVIWLF
ncbi:MAG: ComEC/Rec2 family competence protein, partial [Bacillota bacterium]